MITVRDIHIYKFHFMSYSELSPWVTSLNLLNYVIYCHEQWHKQFRSVIFQRENCSQVSLYKRKSKGCCEMFENILGILNYFHLSSGQKI